jgi:hypothetical protein
MNDAITIQVTKSTTPVTVTVPQTTCANDVLVVLNKKMKAGVETGSFNGSTDITLPTPVFADSNYVFKADVFNGDYERVEWFPVSQDETTVTINIISDATRIEWIAIKY